MTNKINADMSFGDVFSEFPDQQDAIAKILATAGLRCLGCAAASFESLEEGFRAHGLSDSEIENLLEKLNKAVE